MTAAPDGITVVDKPAGWTSHDVVGRMRRIAGTRKVGHAGTLDPMATGVLVVGIGRATRLLGHLAAADKSYDAMIRLGVSTTTDDVEGEVLTSASTDSCADEDVRAAAARFVGALEQVPSSVSAIKVDGRRAYARVRAGEQVELSARSVLVSAIVIGGISRPADKAGEWSCIDVSCRVDCSTGTYVRALARDIGTTLGVGGHLRALRRTRVGAFDLARARTLEQLAEAPSPLALTLADAVRESFATHTLSEAEAEEMAHGRRVGVAGLAGVYGAFDPAGVLVAIAHDEYDPVGGDRARSDVVFAPGASRREAGAGT